MPFGVLADLASSKLNPPIDKDFIKSQLPKLCLRIPLEKVEGIYASPSRRCQETAEMVAGFILKKYKKKIIIETIPELREVIFDLRCLAGVFGYSPNKGIDGINRLVLEGIAMGVCTESSKKICQKIEKVFTMFKNSKNSGSKYILITHGFLMQCIELFIKGKLSDTENITLTDLQNTQNPSYVRGFATSNNTQRFKTL